MWLDLDDWPRRAHYDWYRRYELPFFGLTALVDVGAARAWCRDRGASFGLCCWYAAMTAANAVEPLRMRLRDEGVWVHDRVGVGMTVLAEDETFRFAYVDCATSFDAFAAAARERIDAALAGPLDPGDRDDLVHGTTIPWVAFTAIVHSRRLGAGDSVPKVAFGRVRDDAMPVSLEAHHALVDGLHAGRFFERFEALLSDPDGTFAPTT